MRESLWFRRLETALGFGSGFEIFLLLGRGSLARPGLARIAGQIPHRGVVRWHPLHLDGLDGLLALEQPEDALHLVHGFERMAPARASDLAARLNLNRDRLEVLRGPVIFWIPTDFYEELLSQAPDFVAWRSQATVVPDADLRIAPEQRAEEELSCLAQIEGERRCRDLPELDVIVDGQRQLLLEWARRAGQRSLRYQAEDHSSRAVTWVAWQLARARDRGQYAWVPALLPATVSALADGDPLLAEGVRRLWAAGSLDVVVAASLTPAEWRALIDEMGDNRLLAPVRADDEEESTGMVELAPLSPAQSHEQIRLSTLDLDEHERSAWREVLTRTVGQFGERIERAGALAAVNEHWRRLGLSSVQRGLSSSGWRAHSLRNALSYGVSSATRAVRGSLERVVEPLHRVGRAVVAIALAEIGRRLSSEGDLTAAESLLKRSLALFREDAELTCTAEYLRTLVALARDCDLHEEEQLPLWWEALEVMRRAGLGLDLHLDVLDGLALCLYLVDERDEAMKLAEDGLRQARERDPEHPRVVDFDLIRVRILRDVERFADALAILQPMIASLEATEDDEHLLECWELCDECYSGLDQTTLALEAGQKALELQRERAPFEMWPQRLLLWAQRLYWAGELERARTASDEARDVARRTYGDNPLYGGETYFAELHAEICTAVGDLEVALAARREAVAIHRHHLADAPWLHPGDLARALSNLAQLLDTLGRNGAQEARLEAARLWEDHLLEHPTPYPSELIATLTNIAQHALAQGMNALAVGTFARVLELVAPHPAARESEAIRAIESRLHELVATTGLDEREGLDHYRGRLAAIAGP